jgi:RNA polymerase sigma-70 factor, ECF subfamily
VYRIAVNHAIKAVKRSSRYESAVPIEDMEEMPDDRQGPLENVMEQSELKRLSEEVAKLPAKQKAILLLRIDRDLPFAEIAQIMKRTIGAVKANYFHAVRNLQSAFHKEESR